MARQQEYRFVIDGVKPRTIPASRLLEYISDIVKVLGENRVHLVGIEESSTVPVLYVPHEHEKKTQQRILQLKSGRGPRDAREATVRINNRLADDQLTARLDDPTRLNILEFPGAEKFPEPSIGPITEQGYVQGEVVQIGGRDDSITVYLRSEGEEFRCSASRAQGRELAKYIFNGIVRAFGTGHWYRTPTGKWQLQRFDIQDFSPVDLADLNEVYRSMRGHQRGDPSLLSDLDE